MSGLIAEVAELLKLPNVDPQLREAALVTAAQKLEAHELTCYASAHNFARLLSFHEDLRPLEESFHEEQGMEEQVSAMSESLQIDELESEKEIKSAA
jgi:ferritin-like metal-binding protein YciE